MPYASAGSITASGLGAGALASTGTNTDLWLIAAAVLIMSGLVMFVIAKRRQRRDRAHVGIN